MTEQFANNATTTLNGTITNVQTSIVVTSATLFPSTPQFRIIIESEIMLVTGVSGTTFTVTRGAESTTPATHNNGVTVSMILTAGALTQLKTDAVTIHTLSSVKTAPYVMSNTDDVVLFNTTSGTFSISLPASPVNGEQHILVDSGGQAAFNPLTVNGNGKNIVTNAGSTASTDTIGNNYGTAVYIYNGTNWSLNRSQNTIGTRILPDSNDLAVWTFQESAAPFTNFGTGGTDSIQLISGTTNPQASGLVLPYSLQSGIQAAQLSTTTSSSATDSVIEPAFPVTISMWCKLLAYNTSGAAQHLIAKLYRPYSTWASPFVSVEITFSSASAGVFNFITSFAGPGGITTSNVVNIGEWLHFGFTYDGSTMKQYVNGGLVASAAKSGAIDYGTHGPWIFGQNPAFTSEGNFVGFVQDIRIANVIRSASWFRTVYRAGVGLSLP